MMQSSHAAFCPSQGVVLFRKDRNILKAIPKQLKPCNAVWPRRNTLHASLSYNLQTADSPNTGMGATSSYTSSTRYPNLNLHKLTWEAKGNPQAGVLIAPGHAWHSGWFAEIGLALSSANCTTVALDGIGMGRSDNLRGHRCFIRNIDDHVQDLGAELKRLEAELPAGTPLYVLGESAGGLSATALALNQEVGNKIRGYILCAPALRAKEEVLPPAALLSMIKFAGRVFPELPAPGERVSGETWDMAFGDERYAQLSKRDELVGYGVAMRMGTLVAFLEAMDAVEEALQQGKLKMQNVLVLHNRKDARTDFGCSQRLVQRVKCEGVCELVEPGGNGHMVFQDKQEVTRAVVERVVEFVLRSAGKENAV